MRSSRTLSPLHFEDLEPHRFEDLVRQLAYSFREWHALEATGRLGGDEGVDIRGVERTVSQPQFASEDAIDDSDEAESTRYDVEERVWFFQCKREKSISPARIAKVIAESLPASQPKPYGFVLAAATDFSAKARAVFRAAMNERSIQEFALWGKSDLEDLLFEPRHDHLLFAYFGVSLQVRRRSARTRENARLVMKRKLIRAFGEIGRENPQPILLRDAESDEYPHPKDLEAFERKPTWRYYRFAGHLRINQLGFVINDYFAEADFQSEEWDRFEDYDEGYPNHPRVWHGPERDSDGSQAKEMARRYWLIKVPQERQAHFRRVGLVHYDRIVAVDDIGDRFHPPHHLLLACDQPNQLFDDMVDVITSGYGFHERLFRPRTELRRPLLPAEVPEINDADFEAALGLRRWR